MICFLCHCSCVCDPFYPIVEERLCIEYRKCPWRRLYDPLLLRTVLIFNYRLLKVVNIGQWLLWDSFSPATTHTIEEGSTLFPDFALASGSSFWSQKRVESYIDCGATAEMHLKTNFGNTCFPLALQAFDYGKVYAAVQLHILFDISSVMILW